MLDDTLAALSEERCAAILRHSCQESSYAAMEAAVRGGFRVIEFTLTTPGALELIRDFAARDHLLVGAGTVLDVASARAAVDAGARFLVSPVFDREIVRMSHELGAVAMPGVSTPTEMWCAHQAGARVLKIFPAVEKSPEWLRSCLGPLPQLRLFPTSGVTLGNARAYLEAGAFGVGFVAPLFDGRAMRERDWTWIETRANALLEIVRQTPRF